MADASVGFVNNPDDVPFASQAEEDAWEAAHPIVVRRGAGPTGAPALGGSAGQAIPPSGADLSKLRGAMGAAAAPSVAPPPFQWDGKGDPFADLPPAASLAAPAAPTAPPAWSGKGDPFADLDRSVPAQQAADKAKLATPSSLVGQIGSGLSQGAIDILGLPGDLITGAGNLVSRGINAATGSHIPIVTSPIGSEAIGNAFGAINPRMNPANVPPQNTAEALARGIGAGAASALVPEMAVSGVAPLISGAAPRVAEALPAAFGSGANNAALAKNAAIGAGAGLAGEGAAAASPDAVKPYARLAGNLVGGATGGLLAEAPGAAGAAVRAGREYAQPFTAGGQSAAADAIFANKIVQDRAAALEALRNYQGSAIPEAGAEAAPTTFQATGDMGIGAGERAFETANPIPFQQRRTAQNNARVAVLERLQPTGDPGQVAAHIQAQLADLDDMTNGIVGQATKRAQTAGAAIPEVAPEESGAAMRRGLIETNKGAKAWERALWSAVDPDGTLRMGAAPIANGARRIQSTLAANAKPMEGEEAAIFKASQALEPVSKFSEITALRSRISDEMRRLRNAGEDESQSFARLTQLRGAVEQAITEAAENKAAHESTAVVAGDMRPEDTTAFRIAQAEDEYGRYLAASDQRGAGASARQSFGENPGAGENGSAGPLRAEMPATEPGRSSGRDQGISQKAGERFLTETPPKSLPRTRLLEYLAARGGLKPTADLEQIFGKGVNPVLQTSAGARRLFNPKGMTLNDAFQAAKEGRYSFDAADVTGRESRVNGDNHILELLDRDNSGHEVRPEGEIGERDFEYLHAMRSAEEHVRAELKAVGVNPADESRAVLQRAIDYVADPATRMEPLDAYKRARADFPRESARAPEEGSGQPPLDETEHAEPNVGDHWEREFVSPKMDEDTAAKLKMASAATRERKQTFGQGPVGEALRTQGSADNFKVLDSAVGQKFFKPGMTGAETARAFREATGNSPDAMAGLANYAALTLRKAAMRPDGTLDPKAFETWRGKYGEALKELPGLAGSFANAAKAAEAVDAATAMRSAALKAYEQGAVGKVLKVSDPEAVTNTVGAIFGEKDAIQQMRQLASEVASNPAARDGLRRAVAKFMAEKFISNREAGTSGVNALKGDAFQTFVRKNRPALAQVLKPDEIKGLEAVAKSLAEANRSIDALKLPGRSNTAQDINALAKIKPPENKSPISLFTEMIAAGEVGAHVGGHTGMIAGAGLSMGRHMLGAVRAAGMKNVRDLVEEMILNPELARAALERAPVEKTTTRDIKFRQRLNRIATIAASRMISQKQQGQH